MSGTMWQLKFSVVVDDTERWTAEHRAQMEAAEIDGGSDDWVAEQLQEAMSAAGNAFIAAHPDLFRGELV